MYLTHFYVELYNQWEIIQLFQDEECVCIYIYVDLCENNPISNPIQQHTYLCNAYTQTGLSPAHTKKPEHELQQ